MVDYIIGKISHAQEQEIIIDMGFIGVSLQVPDGKSFMSEAQAKVYTHLHWSAENGPSLFGFVSPLDRSVFRIVIGCSGIGPKIALAILADLGAQVFIGSIATGDEQLLSKVSGIGKKKAEQIIVQLKHKVAGLIESGIAVGEVVDVAHIHDVTQALQSLNYSRQEISKAMDYLKKTTKMSESTFDYLLRQALSYLSKQL